MYWANLDSTEPSQVTSRCAALSPATGTPTPKPSPKYLQLTNEKNARLHGRIPAAGLQAPTHTARIFSELFHY